MKGNYFVEKLGSRGMYGGTKGIPENCSTWHGSLLQARVPMSWGASLVGWIEECLNRFGIPVMAKIPFLRPCVLETPLFNFNALFST